MGQMVSTLDSRESSAMGRGDGQVRYLKDFMRKCVFFLLYPGALDVRVQWAGAGDAWRKTPGGNVFLSPGALYHRTFVPR